MNKLKKLFIKLMTPEKEQKPMPLSGKHTIWVSKDNLEELVAAFGFELKPIDEEK